MLELFLKKILRFLPLIFRSHTGLEHPRPNLSSCQRMFDSRFMLRALPALANFVLGLHQVLGELSHVISRGKMRNPNTSFIP